MSGPSTVAREFAARHPAEAARALGDFSIAEVGEFIASLPLADGAQVLRHMPPHRAAWCLESLTTQGAADVVAAMPLNSCAFILRRMAKESRSGLLPLLPQELRRPLGRLLDFALNTAGDLMDPSVFTLYADMTADDSLLQARKQARRLSHYIPVVDRDYLFKGVITIRDLMLAPAREHVGAVIRDDFKTVRPSTPLEHILSLPQWDAYRELPVVDSERVFLGMLRESSLSDIHGMAPNRKRSDAGQGAARALGELFWLGMSAVVAGASSVIRDERTTESSPGE